VPASVYKTSHAIEAQSKISAAFQTAFQPYGFSQQSVEFSTPANFATDFGPQVFQAYPEIAKSTTSQNSMPLVQPDWKSGESSLTSEFDCEISSMTSRVLTPLENETTSHESQENTKSQISVLHASRCQHCSQIFSIERLGNHIRKSHKHLQHPNICGGCKRRFSLPKDLERHLETSTSCGKGSARPFACKCGSTFTRKDHLLRHIRTMAKR
jgi:hypothetical protein